MNPYEGFDPEVSGDGGVLDLATGEAGLVPGATVVTTMAFSPDGAEIAVQHSARRGGACTCWTWTGAPVVS